MHKPLNQSDNDLISNAQNHKNTAQPKSGSKASQLKSLFMSTMSTFPWQIDIKDWEGNQYSAGQGKPHWRNLPMHMHIKTERAGKLLMSLRALPYLDAFLAGEVDFSGNLFLLAEIRNYVQMNMSKSEFFLHLLSNYSFQTIKRAQVNVKSHYDISQEALNIYLDKMYMSYSCGMWEKPTDLNMTDLLIIGKSATDPFDSLEKSHWRKYKDAVDFIQPAEGETLLDVGCGYGGQLVVALENQPFGKVVGWTHSNNQVTQGKHYLQAFNKSQYELNEGDYRQDNRVFDHITSTGMVSHVGPRGLIPYVKNIRKRIKKGGRYVHHALMIPAPHTPMDKEVGIAFNKKYVWPGFHWFTIGEHIKALEQHGFEVAKMTNLSQHYTKTTAAWYERMMSQKSKMVELIGEQTFRAWQIYLAGSSGALHNKKVHVYRIYCEAI